MPANDRQSNHHLMTLVAILIVLMMALLTAIILMRSGDKSSKVLHAKPWKSPTPESSRPPISTIPTSKSTDFPTTVTTKKPRNVCESPECITLAHQLHNWRDPSVDPCTDFFKATCGKYNEQSLVKGNRLRKKDGIVKALIKEFLLKNQSSTSKSENSMKLLYGKCRDVYSPINKEKLKLGWKEMFADIQKIGSWPSLDKNWNESDFNLNDMLSKIAEFGMPRFGFFDISPKAGPILDVYPDESKYRADLEQLILGMLKINGVQPDINLLKNDMKEIVELKKELTIENEFKFNLKNLTEIELSDLQTQIPSVDYERIINSMLNSTQKVQTWDAIKNKIVTRNYSIFFSQTNNLETILKTTPKRTLANYLFDNFLNVLIEMIVTKTDCESKVIDEFPLAALRVFVRNHFDKENLKIASKMVDDLKESVIEVIQKSKWLHDETKNHAIRKVEMMETMVGYPEELEEPEALDKTFEKLDLSLTDSYFMALKKVLRFQTGQSVDYVTSMFPMNADTIVLVANARYYRLSNSLVTNIPILDDPFLDSTYPEYAKIAGIGYVIGHEIGHGFDPEGRKINENGKERDWWTPEDSAEYEKRAQCFVEQYNKYDDPSYGKNLNGSKTIKEIVADIIGMEVAWNSYKKLDLSSEPSIIGFEDYSTDKLFFHLTALTWCSPRDTTPLEDQLKFKHPTESFRINGVYLNMKSFAETFNCPIGTPMNPEKKCELF